LATGGGGKKKSKEGKFAETDLDPFFCRRGGRGEKRKTWSLLGKKVRGKRKEERIQTAFSHLPRFFAKTWEREKKVDRRAIDRQTREKGEGEVSILSGPS